MYKSPMSFVEFDERLCEIEQMFDIDDTTNPAGNYIEEARACAALSRKFYDDTNAVWYYFIDCQTDKMTLYEELVRGYNFKEDNYVI